MATGDEFEGRLQALEASRVEAEETYFGRLRDLEARVATAIEATTVAGGLAAGYDPPTDWSAIESPPDVPPIAERDPVQEPRAVGWRAGGGWLRRRLNGFARWLLRDLLQTLDERHEAVAASCRALAYEIVDARREIERVRAGLAAGLPELRAAVDALGRVAPAREPALHARIESVRESVARLAEALDLLAGLAERQRLLTDAKDAENLTRATGGPMRHTGLLLDELARQQEALLAELVGKRQELEALVARARGDA